MAKIILSGSGEPENPDNGKYVWWIDSIDGKMKYKDSAGIVTEVSSGVDGVDGIDGVDGDSMFETNANVITQLVTTDVFKPSLLQIGSDETDTTGWGAEQVGRLRMVIGNNTSGTVNLLQVWAKGGEVAGDNGIYRWCNVYSYIAGDPI